MLKRSAHVVRCLSLCCITAMNVESSDDEVFPVSGAVLSVVRGSYVLMTKFSSMTLV